MGSTALAWATPGVHLRPGGWSGLDAHGGHTCHPLRPGLQPGEGSAGARGRSQGLRGLNHNWIHDWEVAQGSCLDFYSNMKVIIEIIVNPYILYLYMYVYLFILSINDKANLLLPTTMIFSIRPQIIKAYEQLIINPNLRLSTLGL